MFDGEDWRELPLLERKARLKDILGAPSSVGRVAYCDRVDGEHGQVLYAFAIDLGCEGIIAKRPASLYRGGQNRDWLKITPPEVRKRQAENVRERMTRRKSPG